MNTMEIIDWFKTTKTIPVEVNGNLFDCIKGKTTESGFYKNGFKCYVKEGKNKKRNYLQIDIYTSAGSEIDIEEKYQFAIIGDTYKLVKWVGWHNVDLMKFGSYKEECMNMLTAIYKKHSTK